MHPCVTVACNAGTQATLLVAVHTRESVSCHVLWTLQGQKGIHQEHFPQADQPAHLDPCQRQEIHLSTFCGHTKPSAGSFGTLLINNNQKTIYLRCSSCSRNLLSWPTPIRALSAFSRLRSRRCCSSATSHSSRSATACLKWSLLRKMASLAFPTLPDGTDLCADIRAAF